jgi:hypothetical protein
LIDASGDLAAIKSGPARRSNAPASLVNWDLDHAHSSVDFTVSTSLSGRCPTLELRSGRRRAPRSRTGQLALEVFNGNFVTDRLSPSQESLTGLIMRRWLPYCAALAWVASACDVTLDLGTNDAAAPYDAACKQGEYVGTYACEGGTAASALALSTGGPIAFVLVPSGADTLAVAPDAALSSSASGSSATETFAGTLDCATRRLTGSLGDVVGSSSTIDTMIRGGGAFTAVYVDDAGSPALVGGVFDPPPTLSSSCSWSAVLQSSP